MKIFLLIICNIIFCFDSKALFKNVPYRPKYQLINFKSYEFDYLVSYFNTTGFYDNNGSAVSLTSDQAFSELDHNLKGSYRYGEKLEFYLGGRYRMISSQSSAHDLTNSGLESVLGGLRYAFEKTGLWNYTLKFQFRHTTYSNTIYSVGTVPDDVIALGDDGNEVAFGFDMGREFSSENVLSLGIHYRIPPNNLSSEIFYNIDYAFVFNTWALDFSLFGIYSLGQDEFGESTTGKPEISSASTNLYNSTNREWLKASTGIFKVFGNWRLGLHYAQVIRGISTDQGSEILLNINWNSGGESTKVKKINKFKEYGVEATVVKVSPRSKFVKIDKGLANDVEKGMKMDIFKTNYFGGNLLIASGVVYQIGSDWAIIRLFKRYSKVAITKGLTARGTISIGK